MFYFLQVFTMVSRTGLLVQSLLLLLAGAAHAQEDFAARNLRTIQSIYNLTVGSIPKPKRRGC